MNEKSLEVLVSTMNRKGLSFLETLNLSTDAVIINQINQSESIEIHNFLGYRIKIVNSLETGLSKSRNLAIKHATADICLIADDDMKYHSDYKEKILDAYSKYPDADIIAFQVKRVGNPNRVKNFRENKSWENYLTSMKISSVELTFKREVIEKNRLSFNPNIGAGTEFYNGEENVFLYDALQKGCKVLYLPIEIAEVDMTESSWFEGYTESYFETVGAKFYNMTNKYYRLLILQFAMRKYRLYKEDVSLRNAYKYMVNGVKKYKNKYKTN